MNSFSDGGMLDLLSGESMGGNAGRWHKYPCVGANFTFDPQTGEIKYFGNYQHVPNKFRINTKSHIFRLALILSPEIRDIKYRIINYIDPKEVEKKALINLKLSVKKYNQMYGFREPGIWNRIKDLF